MPTILSNFSVNAKSSEDGISLITSPVDLSVTGRWTQKTGQGAKLYVRLLKGGTDNGKNQKKAQSTI